ncbi:hypothetical protein SNOG_14206 [Parastagonospora nodorum SN15]|uniref:Uncharacterized protein n=1 Tax=Phaeosphaeria nodorum (strain SN15 / ATCC MYA-4574 / FGSC 10173) TaxID=321614 RepID=Q0U245_PHANO|nr:hypothetical protein SNOG_14206 [Parastagonospora nodorum SN15]EAT78443.2 hypothetical protein SNOG_14206 [Parastagonospora nodorum SN15]
MATRSRRMQGSIGSSWDEGGYSSEDGASIHTASNSEGEEGFEESDKEYTDKATPLLSRSTRASLPQRHETPTNTPTRATARHSQNGSSQSTPRPIKSSRSTPQSVEPSFIMPRAPMNSSLDNLMDDYANVEQEDPELGPWWYVNAFYQNILSPFLGYFWDIFSYANRHFVKPLLGFIMGIAILFFGIQLASRALHSQISTALAPLCLIPGSSYLIPTCSTSTPTEGRAQFEELMNVQGRFESILDSSKDTSDLPAIIKDSELAIRDLRTLVKSSHLPSRSQLAVEFDFFVLTAKEASSDLARYNTRIGAVLDRVIGTNIWTYAVLDGLQKDAASTGLLGRVVGSLTASPKRSLEQRIYDQYIAHVTKNREEIASLISAAQALLMVLTNMDARLDTIFSLAVNDDATISRNHDELLSHLWTKLGGNKASVKSNVKSLTLLRDVSSYRKRALTHVSQTLVKLQEIQSELEVLHDDVGRPELLGWEGEGGLVFQMGVIDSTVERLRRARGESLRVEGEGVRRRINGVEGGDVRELPGAGTTKVVDLKR